MPLQHTTITSLLTPLLRTLRPHNGSLASLPKHLRQTTSHPSTRTFSTTPTNLARPPTNSKGGKGGRSTKDPRISLIRYHLQHPATPRPLRLSRMRALRHWTIHRAWMLVRRKKAETEEGELYRMYQAQHAAVEELRTMDAPGMKDAGRLYRIAMEKKGVFGHGGVPIEYARWQTDTPGKEAWNHGWTR